MICENPFTQLGARAFACGACIACRVKRKMEWSTRLIIEAAAHEQKSFVTLTYRDDTMPRLEETNPTTGEIQPGLPTLIRSDLSDWLKTLRERYHRLRPNSSKLRFFACGEYGDALGRPHYHIILFGYPPCSYMLSRYRDGRTIDCCFSCDMIRDTWKKGIIECQTFAPNHAKYVAGYIMKKMTSKHDVRLKGRAPEFTAMSLQNGGIGINAVPELAKQSARTNYDVQKTVRINGKISPIGRYLTKQVRKALGSPDGKAPDYVQKDAEASMLPLLKAARMDKEDSTLKKQIVKKSKGRIDALKHRETIFPSRKRNQSL